MKIDIKRIYTNCFSCGKLGDVYEIKTRDTSVALGDVILCKNCLRDLQDQIDATLGPHPTTEEQVILDYKERLECGVSITTARDDAD